MKKNIGIVVASLVVVVIGGFALSYSGMGTSSQPSPSGVAQQPANSGAGTQHTAPTTLAQQMKEQPIPHGVQTYGVGQAANIMPEIRQISVDAPDAKVGDAQHFSAIVSSDAKIVSVIVTTKTDNKETPVTLALVGSKYTGSWTISDAHDAHYTTTFTVKDAKGRENSATLTWRDPMIVDPTTGICGQSDGTNFFLSGTCIIGSVDGINGANFTIGSGGTLQINSSGKFAFNSGQNITLSGGGKSLVASGASLVKGFVCFTGSGNTVTADSASCTSSGGTPRQIDSFTCSGVPRPPDCL